MAGLFNLEPAMLLFIIGYVVSVLGLFVTVALAATWRPYLVELQVLSTLALLGGYFVLSGSCRARQHGRTEDPGITGCLYWMRSFLTPEF